MDNSNETSNQKVEFENELAQPNKNYPQRKTPRLIGLVMKFSGGYVKNEQQANYVSIIFAVIAMIISFILFSRLGSTQPKAIQFREDIPLEIIKDLSPEVLKTIPSKFK